jgi:tetratricopeptide (TPR) repeat protein
MLSGLLAVAPARAAVPDDEALPAKALDDLEKGNYEEALEGLTRSWNEGARTPEKAFYLGKVHRALLNYPQARDYLEQAVKMKPDYHEARMLLADTLIPLNQADQARKNLQRLEASGYQPAQVAFLQGLAASKQKQFSQAVDYFRRAQQDPALGQKAKLQLSLALAAQNRPEEARKALREAVVLGPQTQVGGYAQYYLADMEQRTKDYRSGPWRFNVALGFDYDSNVTLQPGDPGAAQTISGRGDVVYSHSAYLEYTPITRGAFSLRTSYAYFQNFHPRLSNFDLLSHTMGLTPVFHFQSSRLSVPFYFNYTDVEADKYYTAFDLNPMWLTMLNPQWGLEAGGRFARRYYWTPVALPQDDRSGRVGGGSLGLYYFFKRQQGYLQARFTYERDQAGGRNWVNSNYRFLLAALYPVSSRLKVNAFVDIILQPYDNNFFDGNPLADNPRRNDRIYIFGTQVVYTIHKGLDFNVHYFFTKADSNIPLYQYDRHIVGCQLAYNY